MIRNMKIGMRLALGFGIAAVMVALVSTVSVYRLGQIGDSVRLIVADRFPKTVMSNDIIDNSNAVARSARNILLLDRAGDI